MTSYLHIQHHMRCHYLQTILYYNLAFPHFYFLSYLCIYFVIRLQLHNDSVSAINLTETFENPRAACF